MTEDDGLADVLRALGVRPDALLGRGGEAGVYALDDARVVRVPHADQSLRSLERRQALVDELATHGTPFALPAVLESGEVNGRAYVVERRLPGRPVIEQLATLARADRDRLVEHHLEAAAALGGLHLEARGWFGELIADEPVRSATWHGFLRDRAAWSVQNSTPQCRAVDATALADELPEPEHPAFVHLDATAGNMLATGATITAVLDIGMTSVVGDARLDPLASAVYLAAPQITPVATGRDVEVAMGWIRSAGLADLYEPARRWLAAYWCFAVDDRPLHAWCEAVLLGES